MPVEIKELVIKSTLGDAAVQGSAPATLVGSMTAEEREALIKEIVNRVLQVLEGEKRKSSVLPDTFR